MKMNLQKTSPSGNAKVTVIAIMTVKAPSVVSSVLIPRLSQAVRGPVVGEATTVITTEPAIRLPPRRNLRRNPQHSLQPLSQQTLQQIFQPILQRLLLWLLQLVPPQIHLPMFLLLRKPCCLLRTLARTMIHTASAREIVILPEIATYVAPVVISSFVLIYLNLLFGSFSIKWGLNCFERSGTQSVPGCSGDGISGKDYCYVPPAGELVLMGNNYSPASAFPLKECQADCDRDLDCDVSSLGQYFVQLGCPIVYSSIYVCSGD